MDAARRSTSVVALAFATIASAAGAVTGDGRTDRDVATEAFLAGATVVECETIADGVTRSSRLTLVHGHETRHAVFKTIDEHGHGPALDMSTHRIVTDFSDSWKHEVAAYRLDRALGLGLVPVTVARRIGGERGSVQEWVEDCGTFRDLVASGRLEISGDVELLLRRLTGMYVLDELIANDDRTWDNILVDPDTDRFALIDHSRAFRSRPRVAPPSLPEPRRLSVDAASRLRGLDRRTAERLLGEVLTPRQLDALAARRNALVRVLEDRGLLPAAG